MDPMDPIEAVTSSDVSSSDSWEERLPPGSRNFDVEEHLGDFDCSRSFLYFWIFVLYEDFCMSPFFGGRSSYNIYIYNMGIIPTTKK